MEPTTLAQEKIFGMDYDELASHVGHKIELNDVWDWHSNRESSLEVRCLDCDTEPLFEVDAPQERKD